MEAAPKASAAFWEGTRNLSTLFQKTSRVEPKSKRREATGRRNYPEAVLNGKCQNGKDVRNASPGMGNGARGRGAMPERLFASVSVSRSPGSVAGCIVRRGKACVEWGDAERDLG